MFTRSVVLAAGCMALVFGCAEPPDETQEIVTNLVKAGFPQDDIQVVDGKVYAGWDAEVSLAASREMLERGADTGEQYRTTNLVSASVTKICIDGSTFTGAFSTALDLAIQNFDEQPLTFAMARTPSAGCSFTINAVIDPNMNGGVAGFPSGGLPFGQITIGGLLSQYGVDVIEHVITHEIGHTIGFRHSDYYNRAISCGSGGNEGDAGVGAIHIPGTPTTAVAGGSLMNSCFRTSETGEFTSSDLTALTALYRTANPICQPTQLSWSAQSLPHQIGRAEADGWSANTSLDAAGFLQYGPYTTQVAAGAHTAVWNLMIDNNTADNSAVVRLEAYDASTATLIAYREVSRREWNAPFQYQSFTLPFTLDSSRVGHALEFRVYWYRTAYVREQSLLLDPSCQPVSQRWSAQSLPHQIGRAEADGWSANTSLDAAGFLQYGPYTTQVAAGAHTAIWNLMIDNNTADNSAVVRLEAYNATTSTLIASRDITRREWTSTFQYQAFALPFTVNTQAGHQFEFRVYWYRTGYVRQQSLNLD